MVYAYFRPGGAFPFFPVPPSALDVPAEDLADLWGRDGATLRERLLAAGDPHAALAALEQMLLAWAVRPLQADPALVRAVAGLSRGLTVAAVADRLGVTDRTLLCRSARRWGSPRNGSPGWGGCSGCCMRTRWARTWTGPALRSSAAVSIRLT
jgi:hypothetical protein